MKGLADLLKKWLNEESCVDKNYDELQKKEDLRIYTMSETYESYTADDYKKQGDIGPYFDVVPLHDYLALRTKIAKLEAKLEVTRAALQFYAGYAGYDGHDFNKALTALKQIEEE